ncbi:MAG: AEC family transporter [Oscillibacter sp.]|nr:AEC family transporter [Oscillibacter sp.]
MNSFALCLRAVLPAFLIIMAGYASKRAGWVREADIPRMNKMAYRAFMPVMCFYNVYHSDVSSAVRPGLLAFSVLGVLSVYALSWLYAALFVKRRDRRGVVIQGLYRSNFLIIGLSFAEGLTGGGDLGCISVCAAAIVPLFNVLAVVTLETYNGATPDKKRLLLNIAQNPLLLGSVAGAVFLFAGISLPEPVALAVRQMGQAASPLLLFLLGAFFRFGNMRSHFRELLAVCAGCLVIVPGVMLAIAALLGFRGIEFVTLMALFASSAAGNSFTMAQQMGGDADLAGDIVVMTSLFCSLTMFLWSLLFLRLGFY